MPLAYKAIKIHALLKESLQNRKIIVDLSFSFGIAARAVI